MNKRISKEERQYLDQVQAYIATHTRGESYEELGRAIGEASAKLLFGLENRLSNTPDSRTYLAGRPPLEKIFYRAFDLLVLDARSDIAAYEALTEHFDGIRFQHSAGFNQGVKELLRLLGKNMCAIGGAILGAYDALGGKLYDEPIPSQVDWTADPVKSLRKIIHDCIA